MFLAAYRKIIHKAFRGGLILKGLDGLAEIAGGIALYFVSASEMRSFVAKLTAPELSEDPHDLVVGYLMRAADHFSIHTRIFGLIYLLSHGVIKLILVWALWNRRLVAYPVAIAVFAAFIAYQLYRYSLTGSVALILLSILDAGIIALTYLEYRLLSSQIL